MIVMASVAKIFGPGATLKQPLLAVVLVWQAAGNGVEADHATGPVDPGLRPADPLGLLPLPAPARLPAIRLALRLEPSGEGAPNVSRPTRGRERRLLGNARALEKMIPHFRGRHLRRLAARSTRRAWRPLFLGGGRRTRGCPVGTLASRGRARPRQRPPRAGRRTHGPGRTKGGPERLALQKKLRDSALVIAASPGRGRESGAGGWARGRDPAGGRVVPQGWRPERVDSAGAAPYRWRGRTSGGPRARAAATQFGKRR